MVAIIAILAGMLLPALNAAREKARAVTCASNNKSINTAMLQYALDWQEYVAMSDDWDKDWHHQYARYMNLPVGNQAERRWKVYSCPADKRILGGKLSYGQNRGLRKQKLDEASAQWGKDVKTTYCKQPSRSISISDLNSNGIIFYSGAKSYSQTVENTWKDVILWTGAQNNGGGSLLWRGSHMGFLHNEGNEIVMGYLDGHTAIKKNWRLKYSVQSTYDWHASTQYFED